ncbi:MAG: serine hydrolase [Sphingobacteriaceae bacterium]|nr:serine hydrolase [Sphingobacteriaceae bacterium]
MSKVKLTSMLFCFFSLSFFSQNATLLDSLFKADSLFNNPIISNPKKFKTQILFTQINRNENNKPSFVNHAYQINENYFYPASTVKLPMSILSLQKLNELNKIPRSSILIADSAFYCQEKTKMDTSAKAIKPSIENYIKQMLLVSDNSAFTRLYEFVGFDYLHQSLAKAGYEKVRLNSRLNANCSGDTAKITPPVYLLNDNGDTLYKQALAFPTHTLPHPLASAKVGVAYFDVGRKKINKPKDFKQHNYFSITDMHTILKDLIFSSDSVKQNHFKLEVEQRQFLIQQMGLYPRESQMPQYPNEIYFDSFKKYFMYGNAVAKVKEDSVRVINVVGRAYGFLIDCAYIIDLKNKVEFLLTAVVFVNERNVIGSGKYEYEKLGLPFLKDLSLVLYKYEAKRKRKYKPDLQEFQQLFNYKYK